MRRLRTYTCQTCRKEFNSRGNDKKFCNLKCYAQSEIGRKKLLAASAKGAEQRRKHKGSHKVSCAECKSIIYTTTPNRKFRFCNTRCRRAYWAELFDELIANPEGLPLPQNYDEFMNNITLPCLLPGCDWEGRSLAGHLYQCHGITADAFKEVAGFNRRTGLVGIETSKALAKPHVGEMSEINSNRPLQGSVNYHPSLRLEGREHMKKSNLGRKHSEETKRKISESNKRTKQARRNVPDNLEGE